MTDQVDIIITDEEPSLAVREALEAEDVRLIIASPRTGGQKD